MSMSGRLFVAVGLPDHVRDRLDLMRGGIPGARWEDRDKLHLTVRFLGPAGGTQRRSFEHELQRIRFVPFSLALRGVGFFPPRGKPKILWAGVDDDTELVELKRRVDRAADAAGFEPDPRKYAPHVTLARMRQSPTRKVAEYLQHHALFDSGAFAVEEFLLMSSVLSPGGAKYRVEAGFSATRP